jgi:hypothetical protein
MALPLLNILTVLTILSVLDSEGLIEIDSSLLIDGLYSMGVARVAGQ